MLDQGCSVNTLWRYLKHTETQNRQTLGLYTQVELMFDQWKLQIEALLYPKIFLIFKRTVSR